MGCNTDILVELPLKAYVDLLKLLKMGTVAELIFAFFLLYFLYYFICFLYF